MIRCAGMPCPSPQARYMTMMVDRADAFRSVTGMTFTLTPHLQRHRDTLVITVLWSYLRQAERHNQERLDHREENPPCVTASTRNLNLGLPSKANWHETQR